MGDPNPSSEKHAAEKSPDQPESVHSQPSSVHGYHSKSIRFAPLMTGACLLAFLMGLDSTVITTAIPQITDEFHSPADVGWYGSAYLLLSCTFQPVYGRAYTHFNVRWTYFVALGAFLIGSLICGLAPTSAALVVGRALAGLGCAGVLAGNLNIVALGAPLAKRPIFISLLGATFGIGLVCGPIIGGVFTSRATWRWCFYINLPIGALTLLITILFFQPPQERRDTESIPKKLLHLDPAGSILVITSITMLLLALQWGGTTYTWHNATIIGLLVGFGVEMIIFIVWQRYLGADALVPLRIMTNRTVASTFISSFLQSGATFVYIFFLPYWFQAVKNASPLGSGVDMIPWMVANFAAAMLASVIVTKTGWFNPPVLLGLAISAVGGGLLTTLAADTSVGKWVGYEILNAAGLGMSRQQYFLAVQAVLPPEDIPIAISFVLFAQNLGGSIFVSVGNSLLRNKLYDGLMQAGFGGAKISTILNAGATDVSNLVQSSQQATLLELYNAALKDVFIEAIPLSAVSLISALPMEWKNLKTKKKDRDQEESE